MNKSNDGFLLNQDDNMFLSILERRSKFRYNLLMSRYGNPNELVSYKHLSEQFKIPVGTVRSNLHRAKLFINACRKNKDAVAELAAKSMAWQLNQLLKASTDEDRNTGNEHDRHSGVLEADQCAADKNEA